MALRGNSIFPVVRHSEECLAFGLYINSAILKIYQRIPPLPTLLEEFSLLPRWDPPTSSPDSPSPWLPTSTSATSRAARTAETRAKAREEHRLVTIKDQMNKMLGEYNDLPFLFPPDHESKVCNAIDNFSTTKHFDWPDNLIDHIKQVMGTPCSTTSAPEFKFKLL